ncbi:MAG: hypothetical protein CXR30_16290 [Geobacter sp.]|nr:MAG: hypothetical protein CXR30_16290 [Geobacter sp.]
MKAFRTAVGVLAALLAAVLPVAAAPAVAAPAIATGGPTTGAYAGSRSCRQCHERFYQLWSTSFHGLAMGPYSAEFARTNLSPQREPIVIGTSRYRVDLDSGTMLENGPDGNRRYPINHVMGGKYVFYFLTNLEKGRLQTLPVAYDLRRKEWFDTALSGVRHYPGQKPDKPLDWKSVPYTFNTACRDCHVSQRKSSYDPTTDTFNTTWKEPGINCETCHGPSEEHNRVMETLPKGQKATDYHIIRTKPFTPAQHNDACNSCHAKMAHLTDGYRPGERFFDHFDLVTLEDRDFYPDGRDLGENYTATSWMLNPCARKSPLHCVTCHTSSGRYRFRKPEDSDKACLPCHAERVNNVTAHSHHPAASAGSRCIGCHMPKTEFARMDRSDHSFLPPTPAATIRFGSPNACNICHADRDAAWADRQVRQWYPRDYQAPVLKRAALVEAARNRDWSRLPEMLAYIASPDRDEIFAASLIRLLDVANDQRTVPALITALKDRSPLVRAAAADTLGRTPTPAALQALAAATTDEYRLVRVAAAGVLSFYPAVALRGEFAGPARRAIDEYLAALAARPVSWVAHYNLGNYYLSANRLPEALAEYEAALRFEPRTAMAWVNAAIVHARQGDAGTAESCLQQAVAIDPGIAVAHYNLGLLRAGQGDWQTATVSFREALRLDPGMADAAANLCLIGVAGSPESVSWCRQAAELQPDEPKFAYVLALRQYQGGNSADALATLEKLTGHFPFYGDAYLLLGDIHEKSGMTDKAAAAYRRILETAGMEARCQALARERLDVLESMAQPPRDRAP